MILQAACIPSKGFFLLAGAAPGAFQTGLMDLDPFRSDPIQIHSVSQSCCRRHQFPVGKFVSSASSWAISLLWGSAVLPCRHCMYFRDLYTFNSCHAFYESLKLNVLYRFLYVFVFSERYSCGLLVWTCREGPLETAVSALSARFSFICSFKFIIRLASFALLPEPIVGRILLTLTMLWHSYQIHQGSTHNLQSHFITTCAILRLS